MDIYNPPKSEITTDKIVEFGGWLRFFQVLNFIWLTFLPLSFLATLAVPFFRPRGNHLRNRICPN